MKKTKCHVKKNDLVMVVAGKEKGKTGGREVDEDGKMKRTRGKEARRQASNDELT